MGCYDEFALERFLEQGGPADAAGALEHHLRSCAACRDRLDRVATRLLLVPPAMGWPDAREDVRPGQGDPTGPAVVRAWADVFKSELLGGPTPRDTQSGDVADMHDGAAVPDIPGLEIRRRIGAGGMGVVYEAFDPGLKRRVAVKMLRELRRSPEGLARLRVEAEAAARVVHPGIVQVHGLGEADGQPWIVLEFVDGPSLAERLGGRPQPPREAAAMARAIAEALAVAHRHQVIHRDLKPTNILLAGEGRSTPDSPLSCLRPKIGDFGLAKVLDTDSGTTRDGQLIGTPTYAAPEQLRQGGAGVGPAADIYSLGAVLYTMLTGRPPLESVDAWRTVGMVLETEPVPPRRLEPGVPVDLETIVLRCLAKDPAHRYADSDSLAEDLRRFLAGEPIRARPIGPVERAWRWARRNPATTATAAALGLTLLLAAVGATVAAIHFHALEQDRDGKRVAAEDALANARQALAESFRTLGLRLWEERRHHTAAVCFAEAAGQLPAGSRLRIANEIRTAAALRFCPRPAALLGDPADPAIGDVAFHPSTRWLIASPRDRSIAPTLWDLERASVVHLPESIGRPTALAWDRDGKRLVVGTVDGQVTLVHFPDLGRIEAFEGEGAVRLVAIAPDNGHVAAADSSGVRVWAPPAAAIGDGAGPGRPPLWHAPQEPSAGALDHLSFSPDGRSVVTVSGSGRLVVRRTGAPPNAPPVLETTCGVNAAAGARIDPQFDSQGRLVVWSDGTLDWYDPDSGASLRTEALPAATFCEVSPSSGDVAVGGEGTLMRCGGFGRRDYGVDTRSSACWLPDGGLLTGGTASDILIRWTPDFTAGSGWPLFQPDGAACLRLSADGRAIATISAANRLRVWHMPDDRLLVRRVDYPARGGRATVSPDGTRILVLARDGTARVHRLPGGEPEGPPLPPVNRIVDALWTGREGGDAEIVALVDRAGESLVERRDGVSGVSAGPVLQVAAAPALDIPPPHRALAVSPDGRRAAWVTAAPRDLVIATLDEPSSAPINVGLAARFLLPTPDADRLVVVAGDEGEPGEIAVVDWTSGAVTARYTSPAIISVRASADGTFLAILDRDHRLSILDTRRGAVESPPLRHPNAAFPEAISADGRLLLTRGLDRNLRLWDWRAGTLTMPPAPFAKDASACLAVGDRALMAAWSDGSCRILDTADGQPLHPPLPLPAEAPPGDMRRTVFSTKTDGGQVAIGSDTGMWIVGLGELLARWTDDGENLAETCRLISGHQFADGQTTPLAPEAWDAAWRRLGRGSP
jgi:WD40 repeat protein